MFFLGKNRRPPSGPNQEGGSDSGFSSLGSGFMIVATSFSLRVGIPSFIVTRSPSVVLNLAVLHRNPAVGGLGDFVAMRHDHQRQPALGAEAMQQVNDLVLALAIEIAGRLVGQEQAWVVGQCPRDRDPLALADGELAGVMSPPMR